MGEAETRRVYLPDVRGGERYLRVTWHPTSSTIVFSHWVGDVCVASTPVELSETARLIGLIVNALQEVIATPADRAVPGPEKSATSADPRRLAAAVMERLRERFRPALAQILSMTTTKPTSPSAADDEAEAPPARQR